MSREKQQSVSDRLETEVENREAITALMEVYNVDEQTATELWHRFIETVKKMKLHLEDKKSVDETS